MRLLLILVILLAFPFVELYLLVRIAGQFGWWTALYLLGAAIVGVLVIREQRLSMFARMLHILQSGHHPLLVLFAAARRLVAGMLLIFPGVLSDVIALVLLLVPLRAPHPGSGRGQQGPQDDGVIEGQWRREEDEHTKIGPQ